MKQLMLAMHNYADVNRNFPAARPSGKDGKPLLSWRVSILPYVEQWKLYKNSTSTSRGTASTTKH